MARVFETLDIEGETWGLGCIRTNSPDSLVYKRLDTEVPGSTHEHILGIAPASLPTKSLDCR
jgi:hypothetical protein